MRPASILIAALAMVPSVLGRSAVISFEDSNTPDSVLEEVKNEVLAAGGVITHTYNIIKGFAIDAPEEFFNKASTLETKHKMRVEADQEMSINSGL